MCSPINCGSGLACDRAISPHTRLKAPTPLDRLGEQARPTVDCIPSGKTQSTVGAGLPAIGPSALTQGSRLQPHWTALASKPAPTADSIPSGKTRSTVGAGLPAIGPSALTQGSRLQPHWTALASKPAPQSTAFLQAKRSQLW